MLFVYSFCFLIFFIGYLSSVGKLKYGLEIAFFFIFLFSALRFDYGNDYAEYRYRFQGFSQIQTLRDLFNLFDDIFSKYDGVELGWVLLNWLFRSWGFEGLIIFTSFFTNLVYYRFIKEFVPREWYWLALFIYIFDTRLFFVPLSMMRQSLGMALFVASYTYIYNKKIIPAIGMVLTASLFHKSAFLLIPFVLFGYLEKMSGKILTVFFVIMFMVLLFTDDITAKIVESALTFESFESYGDYFNKSEFEAADSFGLGFASRLITFFIPFLFFYSDAKQNFSMRLVTLIAATSFMIAPFTQILGFIGRIDYYFAIYNIVAYPLIYNWMKNKIYKYGLLVIYILYIMYAFVKFFADPTWVYFTNYQTIFS